VRIHTLQVALAGVLSIVCCALEGERTRHPDPYAYASAIGELLDGKELYGEIWQDKPPLGLLAYLVPQLIARGSPIALGVWLGLILALQALLVVRVFGREHREAATAAALVLVLLPVTRPELAWLSTDHVSNLGSIGLLAIAWRIHSARAWTERQLYVAGAIAAACFLVRQTSVVFVVPLMLAVAWCPASRSARLLAYLKLGAASAATLVAVLLACLPFIDLGDCLYTVFVYPMRYSASQQVPLFTLFAHELQIATTYGGLVLLLIAIASPRWRPVVVVAIVSFAAMVLPRKGYFHYPESLLPLTAFTAFVTVEMTPRFLRWASWVFVGWLAVIGVERAIAMIREPLPKEHRAVDHLATVVREMAQPGDTVLFALSRTDGSYMHFAAGVPSASPFYLPYQVDDYQGSIMPVERAQILADYRARPPTIIVLDVEDRSITPRALVLTATALALKPPFRLVRTLDHWQIYRR
jgi:hypothetical protein